MADLALQKLVRDRLIASDEVMALVPAGAIIDHIGRPELPRCILLGEGHNDQRRFFSRPSLTLHIWVQEPSLAIAKEITSAALDALRFDAQIDGGGVLRAGNHECYDLSVFRTLYMRDPDGPWSHAVITVGAVMKRVAA